MMKSESEIFKKKLLEPNVANKKVNFNKIILLTSAERQTLHSLILLNERFSSSRSESNNAA